MLRVAAFGVAIAAATLLAACASSRTLTSEAVQTSLPQTVLVEPLPLTVGVYYPSEFRNRHSDAGVVFPVGAVSIALFDRVFASMFKRVVQVERRPPLPSGGRQLAGVIEPEISEFNASFGTKVWVVYLFKLYSPDGQRLAAWTVNGVGGQVYGMASSEKLGDSTARALRNAAAKFAVGFHDEPDVKKWLASLGVVTGGLWPQVALGFSP